MYLGKSARPFSAICIWRNSHRHINSLQKERRWEARSRPGSGTEAGNCVSQAVCALYLSSHAASNAAHVCRWKLCTSSNRENIQKQLMAQQLLLQQQVCPIPRLILSWHEGAFALQHHWRCCISSYCSALAYNTARLASDWCQRCIANGWPLTAVCSRMFSSTHRVWPEG